MSSTPGTASPSTANNQTAASPATGAANAAVTFKVFAGNLSFKTREEELKQAFSAAGNVISANIITRGPRSLGYGFVEFATEAEAKKAVTLLNKKELDGRDINVEVAKTRDESAAANKPAAKTSPSTGAANNNNNRNNTNNNNNNNAAGGEFRRRGGARVAGRGYLRRRGDSSGANNTNFARPRGALRRPNNVGANNGAGSNAGTNNAGRNQQKDENNAPRTASPNTLFVANLPFSVNDKELQEIFQGFAVNSAHVVVKRNGRSKGFGFVEFKTQEDQQKALAATDKKQVQGRELIVKVALTEQANEAKNTDAPKKDTPAEKKDTPAENKAASPTAEKK